MEDILTVIHTDVVDHRDGHLDQIGIQEMPNNCKRVVVFDNNIAVLI